MKKLRYYALLSALCVPLCCIVIPLWAQLASSSPLAVKGETQTAKQSAQSLANLKQLGLALELYVQDYDEVFPPMNSATQAQIESPAFGKVSRDDRSLQELLLPYLKPQNKRVFLQPGTNAPYGVNRGLTHRHLDKVADIGKLVVFYEAAPDGQGKRAISFFDGSVTRINERDWPQVRRDARFTVRLTGAAALYYAYLKHLKARNATGANGKYYIWPATGRVYYRVAKGAGAGGFRWLAPPIVPVEMLYGTAEQLGLGQYQGYDGAATGKIFGGYSTSSTPHSPDDVPATL